mgnify:FL=1
MSERERKKKYERRGMLLIQKLIKRMKSQEEMIKKLVDKINDQQEILKLYYTTYQEMKRQNQKKYLLGYIRMRDNILKDIEEVKRSDNSNEEIIDLLELYINDLDVLLEDNEVEILNGCVGEMFDPKIQKPLERVKTEQRELDNKIVHVFGCGYQWRGMILKKIYVSVGDYNNE